MRCQPTAPHALVQAQPALLAADGLQKSPEDRRGALRGTKVVSGYPPKSGAAAPSTRCSGSTALLQAAPDRSGELPHPPADRAHCDRTSPHIRSPLHNQPPLRHPGSRCDIDSHPDCRPFLTLIVAPHVPLRIQQAVLRRKLLGHYGYYGITGNGRSLKLFHRDGTAPLDEVAESSRWQTPQLGLLCPAAGTLPFAGGSCCAFYLRSTSCDLRNRVRQLRSHGSVGAWGR